MKKKADWMTKAKKRKVKKRDRGIVDVMMLMQHYFKELSLWFNEMTDPRHPSYTTYTQADLALMGVMKNICAVKSMRSMEENFNEQPCIDTLRILSGDRKLNTIIQVFTDMQAFRMSETISFGLKPIRSRICRSRFLAFLRFQLLPLRSIFRYLAMRRTSCTDIVLLFNDLTAASILWWICPVTSMINAQPCSL